MQLSACVASIAAFEEDRQRPFEVGLRVVMGDPAPFDKAASVFFDFLRRLEALFFDQAGEVVGVRSAAHRSSL